MFAVKLVSCCSQLPSVELLIQDWFVHVEGAPLGHTSENWKLALVSTFPVSFGLLFVTVIYRWDSSGIDPSILEFQE